MPSTSSRLLSDLNSITDRLAILIRDMPLKHFQSSVAGLVVVAPEYYWGEASAEQLNVQLAIKRDYSEWYEVFRSVFCAATNEINERITEADQAFRLWVELEQNWELRPDPVANEKNLRKEAQRFVDIIAVLNSGGIAETIVIPDTNTIVSEPDPNRYKVIAGSDCFTFLLLPTVLDELDDLKNLHRNPDFREKAKKSITRIKGWRNQGSLRDGVTVNRTVTVKAVASEPDMQHTLSWLDEHNHDDRIIANVLEVQSSYPTARVVLVTGDINLLNKADVARIDAEELEPS